MSVACKKIVVFATALRKSGGLTIYAQFLSHLTDRMDENEYVIFKSPITLQYEIPGVRFVNVDTSSWFRRMLFDIRQCRRLLKSMRFHPDAVLSLQNFGVFGLRHLPQYVYYHNPIALFPNKWHFFRKKERAFFWQKHIYPVFARMSFYPSTVFFVQSEYIKRLFVRYFAITDDRVFVCFPDTERVDADKLPVCGFPENEAHFVYPATPLTYKNHKSLVYALSELRMMDENLLKRIRVHLTIEEGDYPQFTDLVVSNGLRENFLFDGFMEHSKVLSMINGSYGLLFPSEIETFGLPLLEAASLGIPIIVADLGYSRAVVGEYNGAHFVPAYDYKEWAVQIRELCDSSPRYAGYRISGISSWVKMLRMVQSGQKYLGEQEICERQ